MTRLEARQLYRRLLLARLAEEKIRQEYSKDEMKTPIHLGIGGEAISVGVCHALPHGSKTFGTYRNHTLYLALTGNTDQFFGELYGKAIGCGKGKAGSMHLSAPESGLVATSAVVASTIPVAVGAALANAYRKSNAVVAVFFGDGAVEEGSFWESLNFACLRRLKVLFVCEDNGLAIHTPSFERQGFRSIPDALRGFECYIESGNGSDLHDVITLTHRVLDHMSRQPKPGVLHFTYYRFLEHVGMGEDFDAGYRRHLTSEEADRLDPLVRFETQLLQNGWLVSELSALRDETNEQIQRSVEAARNAPFPPPSELNADVFT